MVAVNLKAIDIVVFSHCCCCYHQARQGTSELDRYFLCLARDLIPVYILNITPLNFSFSEVTMID